MGVQRAYPGLPMHVGLAGVTSITKLIKFGMICGIGPLLAMLKRSAAGLFTILADKDPGDVLDADEGYYPTSLSPILLHFYLFGAWEKTLDWMQERRLATRMKGSR
jgi:methylenetetrahydrofolate reductase (NADPH)